MTGKAGYLLLGGAKMALHSSYTHMPSILLACTIAGIVDGLE